MTLTSKPPEWRRFAWCLYKLGLMRVFVFVLLPVYIVMGMWYDGIPAAVVDWRIELREASR